MSTPQNNNRIPPEVQAVINAALAAQAQAYKQTLSRLESRLSEMQLPSAQLAAPPVARFESSQQATQQRKPLGNHRAGSEPAPGPSRLKTLRSLNSSPLASTSHCVTAPPPSHQTPPARPAKKRPNQVTTEDYPKEFKGTKVSFFFNLNRLGF